jgi:uncharacterized protein YdhG (YjbR/CyaY superfamily)
MPTTKSTTTKRGGAREASADVWTDEEKAAMQEHAKEMKANARRGRSKADGEADIMAKIAEMPPSDRAMAQRFHEIVKENAPDLMPRTWYGMPAYTRDGKNVCFFQAADKFKARYATIGFDEAANLDDGVIWPTSWAVTELTPQSEALIADLVRKAVS